ncbi:MAG: DUF4956 domain-containing protein [Lachnospiraceae bacterium]|jgi:hypothetical protein|nr:DUF4956 domain-containing protein [Lachnospiraceae bacterium]
MENIFRGLFDAETASIISVADFMICIVSSLVIGLIISVMYMYRNTYSKSFIVTIATIPAIVCAVIMMVNGNVGAGVAVAGAFSLVRFRSAPGTAKEIGVLFMAMGAGIITGMGYIAYAFLFAVIMGLVDMLYARIDFGAKKRANLDRTLHVTIPEDLDYVEVFDDLFARYTKKSELVNVKTTNMGSLFKLTYHITFQESGTEKAFIDAVRCRNGNLEIALSNQESSITDMM